MRILKRMLIALLGLILIAALAVYLIPLTRFIPQIEQAASQALGQPVQIGGLRLALLPTPHATASDIRIGAQEQVRIVRLSVTPQVGSLWEPVKVLERVELEGVEAPAEFLAALVPQDPKAGAPAPVVVKRISLEDVRLGLSETALPPFDLELSLSALAQPQRIALVSHDGSLRLDGEAQGEGLDLRLRGRGWTLPAGPAVHFDELALDGRLSGTTLDLTRIAGRLYGGSLEGKATLDWRQGMRLGGDARLAGVSLEPLLALFTREGRLSGRLDTDVRFSATAASAGKLAQVLKAEGDFVVREGVLNGVDLAGAARLIGTASGDGNTAFDELTGRYRVAGADYRLERLRARSGLLNAEGQVRVDPARRLSGKVNVELKSGVALVVVPLRVSGSTDKPVLMPTAAAMAGAAAGTAVLGPVGTAVGARVGDAIDKLFKKD